MYIYQQRAQRPHTLLYSEKRGYGEPLVLIHGLGGSCRWWERNTDALAKHFQVHVIDLMGCGKSATQGKFVLQEAAQHVKHWMETHRIRRAHVVGHSMGGFVAAELAADYPDMVEKLVLVDAAIVPPEQMVKPSMREMVESLRSLHKNFGPARLSDICRSTGHDANRYSPEIARHQGFYAYHLGAAGCDGTVERWSEPCPLSPDQKACGY
jgi:pimeloyl-ACP methyl ester carboxylesterase